MTDLTEKWKNGELPDGFYYFKLPDGSTDIASEYKMIRYRLTKDADKVEVLAPVPTYEEWKNVTTCFDYEHKAYLSMVEENQQLRKWCEEFNALDVAKENQQLKELLKECKDVLLSYSNISGDYELYDKITNAIGEKK